MAFLWCLEHRPVSRGVQWAIPPLRPLLPGQPCLSSHTPACGHSMHLHSRARVSLPCPIGAGLRPRPGGSPTQTAMLRRELAAQEAGQPCPRGCFGQGLPSRPEIPVRIPDPTAALPPAGGEAGGSQSRPGDRKWGAPPGTLRGAAHLQVLFRLNLKAPPGGESRAPGSRGRRRQRGLLSRGAVTPSAMWLSQMARCPSRALCPRARTHIAPCGGVRVPRGRRAHGGHLASVRPVSSCPHVLMACC